VLACSGAEIPEAAAAHRHAALRVRAVPSTAARSRNFRLGTLRAEANCSAYEGAGGEESPEPRAALQPPLSKRRKEPVMTYEQWEAAQPLEGPAPGECYCHLVQTSLHAGPNELCHVCRQELNALIDADEELFWALQEAAEERRAA
jgi:hypothetical protein